VNSTSWIAGAATFATVLGTAWLAQRSSAKAASDERSRLWSEEGARSPTFASYRQELADAGLGDSGEQLSFGALHMLCVLGGALGGVALGSRGGEFDVAALLLGWLGGALGWLLPKQWLGARRAQRRLALSVEFPVMLDLLQISMQGGMSLGAAWKSVSSSLDGRGVALADEMRRVDLEVGFGKPWARALESATARTGLDEFRSLGLLLEQTERFGTEMSRAIAVLADSLRHSELASLEERAHEASVKMLFPLAIFLLPATLLLVVGPMLSMLFEALQRANAE
jgi:tight adherence protein C